MLSIEAMVNWAKRYERYLDSHLKIGLAKLKRVNLPCLEIGPDAQTFTNMELVHFGIGGLEVETEEELMEWAMFLIGHEAQHILSSNMKALKWGLDFGFKTICKALSVRIEGKCRAFKKDVDYEDFLKDMQDKGYGLSKQSVMQFCHYILNSLEDGRIERIRCKKRPGFRNYMVVCRGKEWARHSMDQNMVDNIDQPETYLRVVLNQILSLATMSIYEQGFTGALEKSPNIHRILQPAIPHIRNAVTSRNCKGCMEEGIEIIKLFADDIALASKTTELEKIIQELIKNIVENAKYPANSRTEELGEGDNEGYFGQNELSEDDSEDKPEKSGEKPDKPSEDSKGTSGKSEEETTPEKPSIEASQEAPSKTTAQLIKEAVENAEDLSAQETSTAINAGTVDKKMSRIPDVTSSKEDCLPDLSSLKAEYPGCEFSEKEREYKVSSLMPMEIKGTCKALARKIRKIFQNMEQPVLRGRKYGNIDAPKAYKLAMGQMDFFVKKGNVPQFDGCAYLLLDNSGSMGNGKGSKRYYACNALSMIEEAFSPIMPVKITAFDADYSGCYHKVIKNWHENIKNNGSYNFYLNEDSGLGNKDGYSIKVATKELLSQPEKKKMLVVLSDGLPSAYNSEEKAVKDVHDAVQQARKYGIQVVSIYFENGISEAKREVQTFRKMYEKMCIATEPEKIADELVRILKKFCFK